MFQLCGIGILALGVYLFIKDFGEFKLLDIFLNPAILLGVIGSCVSIVSLIGSLGALRDNIFLLKAFAICVFLCYLVIVVATFGLFVLFYSDTTDGLSAHSVLVYAIKNYHTNRNLAEIVDSLQENLECCGVSSVAQGYRDWNLSYQFNCTTANPQPERCGVPFSCCRKSVISEAAGLSNPLLPAMRSLECWQNTLKKRPQDLEHDIYTRGCLQPLRTVFESHAIHIGLAVAVIVIPVCVLVCLTNVLARQIDHQRLLLEREARRHQKRIKRERYRHQIDTEAMNRLEDGKLSDHEISGLKNVAVSKPLERSSLTSLSIEQPQKCRTNQESCNSDAKKTRNQRRRRSGTSSSNPRVQPFVQQPTDLLKSSKNC
ncbi:tetraspanin family protein [Dictyocaulus viviparus]|uniref:Tetraspanin family protein n=1 Tax=Dictyocaulus viviparus TaxID=29172 RepID=A0A0D8X784_DICVI|nr:tetraspanin family protein [Dictyocaulus viviparus]